MLDLAIDVDGLDDVYAIPIPSRLTAEFASGDLREEVLEKLCSDMKEGKTPSRIRLDMRATYDLDPGSGALLMKIRQMVKSAKGQLELVCSKQVSLQLDALGIKNCFDYPI